MKSIVPDCNAGIRLSNAISTTSSFMPASFAIICPIVISKPTMFFPSTYSNGGKAAFVPSFTTFEPSAARFAGIVIFPSTGIKAFTSFSYSPPSFMSAIVLLIEERSSALPFLTAIAYASLLFVNSESRMIFNSGLRSTIAFAGSSSRITASIARFLRSRAASIPVLKEESCTFSTLSCTQASPVVPA